MKLKALLEELKHVFLIEEELRAYLYEDRIEVCDYTSAIRLTDRTLDETLCLVATIYVNKENKINIIENRLLNMITTANADMVRFLTNLIGQTVDDYKEYPKLENHRNLPHEKA